MAFTDEQLRILVIAERTASSLSLCGASFIILTFIFTKRFRRPINRLAFYAAFGNILANIGTVMARDGINNMKKYGKGKTTPLCGFQAFLMQTFIPSDCLICLCMAVNVYLSVIHKFSGPQLRRLEPLYVFVAYSIPITLGSMMFLPPTPGKGPIIGDAVTWCWFTTKYDPYRIGLFYAPIWLILFCTAIVYGITGRVIFKLRHTLREFAATQRANKAAGVSDESASNVHLSAHAADRGHSQPANAIQMTTVTQVQSAPRDPEAAHYYPERAAVPIAVNDAKDDDEFAYNVTVETAKSASDPELALDDEFTDEELRQFETAAGFAPKKYPKMAPQVDLSALRPVNTDPEHVRKTAAKAKSTLKANMAAVAYAKVAFLFFCSALITWLPASMNRVYTLVHKEKSLFPFALASGMVLSSQGFWNVIVYCVTSWTSCKAMWGDIKKKFRGSRANVNSPVEKKHFSSSPFSSASQDSTAKRIYN